MIWTLLYTNQAKKDAKKIKGAALQETVKDLIEIIEKDPYKNPPTWHALRGKLFGTISRRITYQHRLVYQVNNDNKTIKIIRMWTHYE